MSELQDRFKDRISELRSLAVYVVTLSEKEFKAQYTTEKSKLSEQLRNTLGFRVPPEGIAGYEKNQFLKYIRKKIIGLVMDRLKLMNIKMPDNYIAIAETFIEENLAKGKKEKEIEQEFIKKGWTKKIIDVILEHNQNINEKTNIKTGNTIRKNTAKVTNTVYRFNDNEEGEKTWQTLLKKYKKTRFKEFVRQNGELRLEKKSSYYYTQEDLKQAKKDEYSLRTLKSSIKSLLNTKNLLNIQANFYTYSPDKPLLLEINEVKYLILPHMNSHTCALCGKSQPINKMTKIDLWDKSRTKKITKHVCKEHEVSVWDLLEENRIIQQ